MYKNKDILESSENSPLPLCTIVTSSKVQMNVFFIAEFEREAKIGKIAVYCFLISLLVPEFKGLKVSSHPGADCSRHSNFPSLFPVPTILVTKYKDFLCNLFLLWE